MEELYDPIQDSEIQYQDGQESATRVPDPIEPEWIVYQEDFDEACEYIVAQPDKIILVWNGGETVPENRRYCPVIRRGYRPNAAYFGLSIRHLDSYVLIYHIDDMNTPIYKIGAKLSNNATNRGFAIRGINNSDPVDAWNTFKIEIWRSTHPYGEDGKDKRITSRAGERPGVKRRRKKLANPTTSDLSIMKALLVASTGGVEQINDLIPVNNRKRDKKKDVDVTPGDEKSQVTLDEIYRLCGEDPDYTKESFMKDIEDHINDRAATRPEGTAKRSRTGDD